MGVWWSIFPGALFPSSFDSRVCRCITWLYILHHTITLLFRSRQEAPYVLVAYERDFATPFWIGRLGSGWNRAKTVIDQ
jgi:hypothetical protein